jgi:hypothetical protein
MGPILICDKSTMQGLSSAELNLLRRNYSLNIPPVLLMEVLFSATGLLSPSPSVVMLSAEIPFSFTKQSGDLTSLGSVLTIHDGNEKNLDGVEFIEACRNRRWRLAGFQKLHVTAHAYKQPGGAAAVEEI